MENLKLIATCIIAAVLAGCAAQKPKTAGFLSDYSKLESVSGTTFRYIAPGDPLKNYSKFIVESVDVIEYVPEKISKEDLTKMTIYMHDAIVKALEDRYQIVTNPGPDVAIIRMAITDLKKSKIAHNLWPSTKLVGTGLGGATLEGELLDSQTHEQLGAIIESQLGSRLSMKGITSWGDAKAVMDNWAKRFRQRIDEAHGT